MSATLHRTSEEATLELAFRSYCANLRTPKGDRQLWALAEGFGEDVVVACEARRWLEEYTRRDNGQGDPRAHAAEWLRACASLWLQAIAATSKRFMPDDQARLEEKEHARRNAELNLRAARLLEAEAA